MTDAADPSPPLTAESGEQPGTGMPRTVEGLEVNEVRDGLVVYDGTRDRVHYLNATASVVFVLCDGEHDQAAMAAEVGQLFGVEPPVAEVGDCLANLAAEGLLR